MDIKKEIVDYIMSRANTGALLITGKWGCGKTFLMKEVAEDLNKQMKAAVAVVSLFGIDSISMLNQRVKDEYSYFKWGSLGEKVKKISRRVKKLVRDGLAVASVASGNAGVAAASQGVSSLINYDFWDMFNVQNTVGNKEKERKFVLAFDDLERNNINKKDLLGAINEYVENKQIKVILVADEERIDDEYVEYKEKIVSRTIQMPLDYDKLIDEILEKYAETVQGYRSFLIKNRVLLKQFFEESDTNNIRIFKNILANFERVYNVWSGTEVPKDNLKWVLYTFGAESFASKQFQKGKEKEGKHEGLSFEEKHKRFLFYGREKSSLSSLKKWIHRGEWDEESLKEELNQNYIKRETTPLERFLLYNIWDLQADDINKGMPIAREKAYAGELTRDQIVSLITKDKFLRDHTIMPPCEIDFEKVKKGFLKRIEGIKKQTIKEPSRHTMATDDHIASDARPLYDLVEKSDIVFQTWDNRRTFIGYFEGKENIHCYDLHGLVMMELDDELLEIIIKYYATSKNMDKRILSDIFITSFSSTPSIASEESNRITEKNMTALVKWLEEHEEKDYISKIIDKSFASRIKSRILRTETDNNRE